MSGKGRMFSVLVLGAMVMSVASLGWGATPVKPVEIELWHRWSGPNQETLVGVLREFEKKQPNIVVKELGHAGEYIDLLQKIIANLAAGKQPPDVLIGGYNLMNYIGTELKPTSMDQVGGADAREVYKRYDPAVLKLGFFGGKQIGLPFALSNIVLYYNLDLFKAAGLKANAVPKTWDEVFTVSKTIKDKTGKYPIVIQKIDNWPDQALIFSSGGRLLSDDGNCVAFNNPQAVEAYQMWARLHKVGLAPKGTEEELMGSFTGGGIAMYATTIMRLFSFRTQAKFELGVAPMPAFTGKPKALPGGGAAIMIFSKDPAKQKAAWEVAKYLVSEEGMRSWTKTGYLPVIKGDIPVPKGQEVAYAQLPNAVPWLSWPGGAKGLEIDRLFLDTRTKIIYGELDAKEGLDKAAATANALLGCK